MNPVQAEPDLSAAERFRRLIALRLGLHFDDSKLGFLADLMQRRARASSQPEIYLDRLDSNTEPEGEIQLLASELTVTETYFFRNNEQFNAFSQVVLPARTQERAGTHRLRFLSAGCASGEEPYTIAILVRERLSSVNPPWDVAIDALDVNPEALARAREGRYSSWALRETPAETVRKWFVAKGKEFTLHDSVRVAVQFHHRNLIEEHPFWQAEVFDAIFCRNVLMYFSPERAKNVVERLERALAPGGYLFLGHAENLRGLSQGFQLCHTHGTFYYRKKERAWLPTLGPASRGAPPRPAPWSAPLLESADTWVETIGRASERIKSLALVHAKHDKTVTSSPEKTTEPGANALQPAMELFQRERYGQALDHLHSLPANLVEDPEVLLLRAALLTQKGALEEAASVCEQILSRDELNTGAHYLAALCCEGRGDADGAIDHDQAAIHLDAAFAMPHLHLGLMARRRGDFEAARAELQLAHSLFEREDAARILLFGGGFNRESLLALSHAQLLACGGNS